MDSSFTTTDDVVHFLKHRATYELTDHQVWVNFCTYLEASIQRQRKALQVSEDFISFIENTSHGGVADEAAKVKANILSALYENRAFDLPIDISPSIKCALCEGEMAHTLLESTCLRCGEVSKMEDS